MGKAAVEKQANLRDGFFFLGYHLALDLVNTRPEVDGEAVELLPDFAALVRWFRAAGLMTAREAGRMKNEWGESARGRRAVEEVRELRERLRGEILDWENGRMIRPSMVKVLNQKMREHPMLTRLRPEGSGFVTESWFAPDSPQDLLAPLVHNAADLFAAADPGRVRRCANCVLHFLDSSKKGTRRWCSMQMCGNRNKVAAYQGRRRLFQG